MFLMAKTDLRRFKKWVNENNFNIFIVISGLLYLKPGDMK